MAIYKLIQYTRKEIIERYSSEDLTLLERIKMAFAIIFGITFEVKIKKETKK